MSSRAIGIHRPSGSEPVTISVGKPVAWETSVFCISGRASREGKKGAAHFELWLGWFGLVEAFFAAAPFLTPINQDRADVLRFCEADFKMTGNLG